MAETYVNLADILKKKQFAYDLKQYAVTEKDVRSARKIEIVPDEDVSDMESAIKALAKPMRRFERRHDVCMVWRSGEKPMRKAQNGI